MSRIVIALLFGMSLTTSVLADEKRELARELTDLMEVDAQFDHVMDQMGQMFSVQDFGPEMSPSETAIIERHQVKMFTAMQEAFGGDELRDYMIDLYASYFNEKELKDMIEFHQTPTGQRMIEIMPMIMEDSALHTQEKMMEFMPTLQAMSKELEAEITQYRQQQSQTVGQQP
jgi:hypothetical protein